MLSPHNVLPIAMPGFCSVTRPLALSQSWASFTYLTALCIRLAICGRLLLAAWLLLRQVGTTAQATWGR